MFCEPSNIALINSLYRKGKIMKKIAIASLSAVLVATIAVGYELHHPNLRDAYGAAENAIHHVQEAQAANKGVEFGGHAEKAIDAWRHAQPELIEGDKWNDAHHK
jgi:hypothetical protein